MAKMNKMYQNMDKEPQHKYQEVDEQLHELWVYVYVCECVCLCECVYVCVWVCVCENV